MKLNFNLSTSLSLPSDGVDLIYIQMSTIPSKRRTKEQLSAHKILFQIISILVKALVEFYRRLTSKCYSTLYNAAPAALLRDL